MPMTDDEWDAARDRITETNQAVAAERERIRNLAVKHMATYWKSDGITGRGVRRDFDELIGDPL